MFLLCSSKNIIIIIIIIIRIIMIIIIIIAFKGAIRDFLQSPHSAANSNTYAQVARAQSCANHVLLHIERLSRASVMLRATWYEWTAHLLSFDRVEISFI